MRPPLYATPGRPGPYSEGPAGLLGRIRSQEQTLLAPVPVAAPAPFRRRGLQTPGGAAFAKLMVTMIVLAAIASLAGGTFASFNATTQNSTNTFQTGTVLLSTTQPNGSQACVSYGTLGSTTIANGNSNTCPPITLAGTATGGNPAAVQSTAAKPADAVHAHMTVQNVGSLNASSLVAYSTGTANCTTTNNPNTAQHGTATDLCSTELQLYIQEYSCSGFTAGCIVSSCVYPADAANACTSSPSNPATLGGFTQHTATGSGNAAPISISGSLNAGATRYFDVVVTLPASAPNTYQGLQAQFDLVFQIAS